MLMYNSLCILISLISLSESMNSRVFRTENLLIQQNEFTAILGEPQEELGPKDESAPSQAFIGEEDSNRLEDYDGEAGIQGDQGFGKENFGFEDEDLFKDEDEEIVDEYEVADPKLPSQNYTYGDLLDEIIDSAGDVVDTATDLKKFQDRIISSIDDIKFEIISVALDDDETALEVVSDIEECIEDEEVYDESDDSKIWGIVNSCWNIRPEVLAANLLAYNTYWVLYAIRACHGVDVEYEEIIGAFYQNPEDEFQEAAENEIEEVTDHLVLLSLKDFSTTKIYKINLLQQILKGDRDHKDIVNELETLYSDILEEIYRSCYEAYELRNELRENLYEAHYNAYHLPYPDEEPSNEVIDAYEEVLSE